MILELSADITSLRPTGLIKSVSSKFIDRRNLTIRPFFCRKPRSVKGTIQRNSVAQGAGSAGVVAESVFRFDIGDKMVKLLELGLVGVATSALAPCFASHQNLFLITLLTLRFCSAVQIPLGSCRGG
jgi:hypothetical protein